MRLNITLGLVLLATSYSTVMYYTTPEWKMSGDSWADIYLLTAPLATVGLMLLLSVAFLIKKKAIFAALLQFILLLKILGILVMLLSKSAYSFSGMIYEFAVLALYSYSIILLHKFKRRKHRAVGN